MEFSTVYNVLRSDFTSFEEQILESLTAQQKKVALVVVAIFSLFAAVCLTWRYCFQAKKIDSGGKNGPNMRKSRVDQNKVDQNKRSEQGKIYSELDSNDPEYEKVKRMIEQNGLDLLNYPQYQDDERFVKLAINNHPYAVQYASLRLRGDAEFMKLPIERNGYTAQYATENLRNENRFLAKLAVSGPHGDGTALEFFPAFQDDDKIVTLAFKQNPRAIDFASARLKSKFRKDEVEVEV